MDSTTRGGQLLRRGGTTAVLLLALLAPAVQAANTQLAEIRTQLVNEYIKVGNLRVALDSANEAVEADSNYMPGFLLRAYVEQLLGMHGEAERDFQKALALNPNSPEANNNYGWFLCSTGRINAALSYFDRALSNPLYESPFTARTNKAVCLGKLGQAEAANHLLLEALQQNPSYVPALRELSEQMLVKGNAELAKFYFNRLTHFSNLLPAEDLWLGVRVARAGRDNNLEALLAEQLKSRFPVSKETQLLLSDR